MSDDRRDPKFADNPLVFEIADRTGLYRETTTWMSKYHRRGRKYNLDKLSYAQFCKEYDPGRSRKKKRDSDESDQTENEEDAEHSEHKNIENPDDIAFNDRIFTGNDEEVYRLPNIIKLTNVCSGEPPYMKRRKTPSAIRFHKIKDKNSHECKFFCTIHFKMKMWSLKKLEKVIRFARICFFTQQTQS